MQQGGEAVFARGFRVQRSEEIFDNHAVLGDAKGMVARGLSIPPRHTREAPRSRSRRRPESMRCQARLGDLVEVI